MTVMDSDTAAPRSTRRHPWGGAVAGAGLLLVVSETVERIGGGLTPASYTATIAAFAAIAATAWILHRGQGHRAGRYGLVATALFTIGAGLESVVDVIGFGEPTLAELQESTGLLGAIAGPALVIGTVAFGVAVLRARVLPRWTGIVAVTTPWLLVATSFGLPTAVASIGNMILGAALAAMGLQVARGHR